MYLSRQSILQSSDLPREVVSVPEWGGQVVVRTLTGAERDDFEKALVADRGPDAKANLANIRAKLCALTICDNDGERLFSDADAVELGKKSAKALDRVFAVASRLSGISKEDVEELGKRSAPTAADASASPSPASSVAPSASSSPASTPAS